MRGKSKFKFKSAAAEKHLKFLFKLKTCGKLNYLRVKESELQAAEMLVTSGQNKCKHRDQELKFQSKCWTYLIAYNTTAETVYNHIS